MNLCKLKPGLFYLDMLHNVAEAICHPTGLQLLAATFYGSGVELNPPVGSVLLLKLTSVALHTLTLGVALPWRQCCLSVMSLLCGTNRLIVRPLVLKDSPIPFSTKEKRPRLGIANNGRGLILKTLSYWERKIDRFKVLWSWYSSILWKLETLMQGVL